ncbi:MAG: hypothetical protein JWN56_969 [Sphingobacteriales bacterium]|nr:hypothetical protein [Sphingobacteriales bacterium]
MKVNENEKGDSMPGREAAANRIAGKILRVQNRTATFLNAKTAHYSKCQKQILLLIISTVFGGVSVYLIFQAII